MVESVQRYPWPIDLFKNLGDVAMIEQRLNELINHRIALGYDSENVLDKALTLDFARKTFEVMIAHVILYGFSGFLYPTLRWTSCRRMSRSSSIRWKGLI